MDYNKCAKEILAAIGGKDNLVSAAHCATRLRLVIVDNDKTDQATLEDIDGVKGVFESAGQLQIIIGTGTVNKVYDEFIKEAGVEAASKDDVKAAAAAKAPMWKRAIKTLGDVFVPILPAIVASGLLMGIVEAIGKVSTDFSSTDWYAFLDMMSSTAFAFLPVLVAASAAKVFGANIYLGVVMGLMMVHPSLLNGWNVGNVESINEFFGVTDGIIPTWNLFGDLQIGDYVVGSISQHGYQGHVIPVVIVIWLMSKIEKWLHKHVPEMIDLFVVPITTIFISALAAFIVIGPIFSLLENYVLAGAEWLVQNPFGAAVVGFFYPATVVMGLHHMYNVIEAGMLAAGDLNTWMPIATAANFAQAAAALAVGLKAKNGKTKTIAIPSALSASLGITEPAIFGINFRFFKPFICAMIGGAVGGLFAAIVGLGATAYGVTGFPGFLIINNIPMYCLLLLISGGVAFILTWIIWKEGDTKKDKKAKDAPVADAEAKEVDATDTAVDDTAEKMVCTPVDGKVIPLTETPDETFASEALGKGGAIIPTGDTIKSPVNGTVNMVFDTGHAVGLESDDGVEILVHIGINTVELNGNGFETIAKEGDKVKVGDPLIKFDEKIIKDGGYNLTTPIIVTNTDDFASVELLTTGDVTSGTELLKVQK
ncbi:MAG: glucose PTS transporter subunit IIA [Lachnospiraceae bacterium]|nr:glucose PTS transporter subunit IIA [Lachnospiraceae bacterium]